MKKLKNNRLITSIVVLMIGFVIGSYTEPCVMLLTFFVWLGWVAFVDTSKGSPMVTFCSWVTGTISIFVLILILKSGCNLWTFESNLEAMAYNSGLYYNCATQVEALYTNSDKLRAFIEGR